VDRAHDAKNTFRGLLALGAKTIQCSWMFDLGPFAILPVLPSREVRNAAVVILSPDVSKVPRIGAE